MWFLARDCEFSLDNQSGQFAQSPGRVCCPQLNDRRAPWENTDQPSWPYHTIPYWSTRLTFTVLDFEPYPAITCFDKIVTTLKNWKGNMDTLSRWKISHMVVSKRVLCKKVATCFDSKWEAGWMMEGPSVNPSASIAVHYIHWPWRRDPLSSDAREGCDASSREKLLATSGEEGTQLQSYCNQLKLPGEN